MVLVARELGNDRLGIEADGVQIGDVYVARSKRAWFRRADEVWHWSINVPISGCSGTASSRHEALIQFRDNWIKLERETGE